MAPGRLFFVTEFFRRALRNRLRVGAHARRHVGADVFNDAIRFFTGGIHFEVGNSEVGVSAGLREAFFFRLRFFFARRRCFFAAFEARLAVGGKEALDAKRGLRRRRRDGDDHADEQRKERKADARPHTDLPS